MYRPGDRVTRLSMDVIRHTLARRNYLRIGSGISIRAFDTPKGYKLLVRAWGVSKCVTVMLPSRFAHASKGMVRQLICAKCNRTVQRNLYIDWDTLTARCLKCSGIPPDLCKPYLRKEYDFDLDMKFRKIIRRIFVAEAVESERRAIKSNSAIVFFADRPYLVPPLLSLMRTIDKELYHKMLRDLHKRYKWCLRGWKGIFIDERDRQWATEELERRLCRRGVLTFEEEQWMKEQIAWVKGGRIGSPPGTAPDPSSSAPTETVSSLLRILSNPDTNVDLAAEREKLYASLAEAEDATTASRLTPSRTTPSSTSSAPNVKAGAS